MSYEGYFFGGKNIWVGFCRIGYDNNNINIKKDCVYVYGYIVL